MKKCPIDSHPLYQSRHTLTSYICDCCKNNKRSGIFHITEIEDSEKGLLVNFIKNYRLLDIPAFDNPKSIDIAFQSRLNTETGFISEIEEKDLSYFDTKYGQSVPEEADRFYLDFPIVSLEDSLREAVWKTDDNRFFIPLHKLKFLLEVLQHNKK